MRADIAQLAALLACVAVSEGDADALERLATRRATDGPVPVPHYRVTEPDPTRQVNYDAAPVQRVDHYTTGDPAVAARLREERRARKAAAFAKRQPKVRP